MQKGLEDRFGVDLGTTSDKAAQLYSEGVDLALSRNFGSDAKYLAAIEEDEGFAVAHSSLAVLQQYAGQQQEARQSAERGAELARSQSRRAQGYADTVALWVGGDGRKAYERVREHLREYPNDAMALNVGHRLLVMGCGAAGVPNYPPELLELHKSVEHAYGDEWSFLGNMSFAHHESGLLDDALRYGERSLEQRPDNANASHSVAHVFFEKGDHATGQSFLAEWIKDYDRRGPFFVHLSWHHALFQLALGRYGNVVDLYGDAIRPSVLSKTASSIADSCSIMWRMQLYGETAPAMPWQEVRDQAEFAIAGRGPGFGIAHAAFACVGSEDFDGLDRMIEGLREYGAEGNAQAAEVTLPLVKGIRAFAQGEYAKCAELIEPLRHDMFVRLGGSHAQREVFEDTLLAAYLRSEQFEKAEELLYARLKQRTSVRDTLWLTSAQVSTGQSEDALGGVDSVRQGWKDADADSPELAALDTIAARASGG